MNIDRLIDRIEKALREEGTTDPVFHALAKEYAKFRTQIDERLEHCVTLSSKDTNDLEKYFVCEICGKVFTPASNLRKHIVTTVGRNH